MRMPLSDRQFWFRSWLCFFAYAALVSVLIQFVLLPLIIPAWHAGHGLLKEHDWVAYHERGVEISRYLRNGDWVGWLSADAGWIEPRVISIPYALIAPEPWSLIPFNAIIHATTALLLSLSMLSVFSGNRKAALVGALPYVFFPSALLWVSQIHKDGANNLGFACYLFGWVLLFTKRTTFNLKQLVFILFLIGFGSYFSWFLRPYLGMVLTICSGILLLTGVIFYFFHAKEENHERKVFGFSLLCTALMLFILYPMTRISSYTDVKAAVGSETEASESSDIKKKEESKFTRWHVTPYVPKFLEDKAFTLSAVRTGFIGMNLLKPNIDNSVYFYRITDIINYIPRGIQLALLAPFPQDWFNNSSSASHNNFFKKIVVLEMFVAYISLPFLLLFFIHNRKKRETWVLFLFSLTLLTLFGLTIANLGTLCRFRYFFLMTWVGIGLGYASMNQVWVRFMYFLENTLHMRGAIEKQWQ